jgi:serine/threonine protein kinase
MIAETTGPTAADASPLSLRRYKIYMPPIGRGGWGSVYRANDNDLERAVAIKIPHKERVANSDNFSAFLREARTAARLTHPNICPVHEFGCADDGTPYIVMAFVDGQPLSARGPKGDLLWKPWPAAELVKTVARAMANTHAQDVVHRDLKPSNILVRPAPGREPVIVDFGLAVRLDPTASAAPGQHEIVGTLPYMSLEHLIGEPRVWTYSDVYSLGVIFYELLTGELPFSDNDWMELCLKIGNDLVVPPHERNRDVPPEISEICVKAMARHIEHRFHSMNELADALEAAANGSSGQRSSASAKSRRTWWGRWTVRTRGSLAQSPVVRTRASFAGSPSVTTEGAVVGSPLIGQDQIVFEFVDDGALAPALLSGRNRLFLDVGIPLRDGKMGQHPEVGCNALRDGVIDQHANTLHTGSTSSLVRNRPDLVQAAVASVIPPGEHFTIVLHESPDLDCVASAHLAIELLTSGKFPKGDDVLAQYVDGVDEGSIGMSPSMPHSLYPAFSRLVERFGPSPVSWGELVSKGVELVDFALKDAVRTGQSLLEVDAFACPGMFGEEDRKAIQDDRDRYERKLTDPATRARFARLRLPSQLQGTVEVEALFARDVQNVNDPHRCLYFEGWARNDEKRCPNRRGFEALCIFGTDNTGQHCSCTISVTPLSPGSLRGLGGLLESAESARRRERYGVDDRVKASDSGEAEPREEGSKNTDPWHDGHEDQNAIVKAPRSGTVLTADELECALLQFGHAAESARPLVST